MSTAQDRLAAEYGATLPPGLAALTAEQQDKLVVAIEEARVRQARALVKATDHGLDFIPKLLRGSVKKVLFG